jgi:predicted naringenin-chalcone synthase
MTHAHIAAVSTALPEMVLTQKESYAAMTRMFGPRLNVRSAAIMRKVFSHPSIASRHFAASEPQAIPLESQDEKIDRFTRWATLLAARASQAALGKTGLQPRDISALIINTCTGYICPGLTSYVIEALSLPRSIRTFDLVGGGCAGALPNLQLCRAIVESSGGAVLGISVEICSATFQMSDDPALIISNAIFGDGAAAFIVWDRPSGYRIAGSSSYCDPAERESIRFIYKNGQLHNQLSLHLPELIAPAVESCVDPLLREAGLSRDQISAWAFHSGGEQIIEAVRARLRLPEVAFAATRKVLRECGNMSSPSVLFVLSDLIAAGLQAGQWIVLTAFGAGMSAHSMLLQVLDIA